MSSPAADVRPPSWHLFVPKLYTALRGGYHLADLRADAVAGATVAIVALPLAMALAIASGTTPDKGLVTAVVAGFLISALGGSRFQIGGPTGAFVVVVFDVIRHHGYDGLVMATLMAGAILVVAGLMRLGTWIKYIPEPVVTGFTSGIAIIIFTSQIKDFFGLTVTGSPAGVVEQWMAYFRAAGTLSPVTFATAATGLAGILILKRFFPKLPGFLIAVVLSGLAVRFGGLPVETIGSRFGGIPTGLPVPAWPSFDITRIGELVPSAFTIAFLAGVESLLSAMVADGMTGRRHRSNCELVGQGVANAASALFGGLPATGALARTATNIRSGGRTPVSGMLHAVFLLGAMALLGPFAVDVPLATLAAILMVVAWSMSEAPKVIHLSLTAPKGDRLVLLVTLVLTVAVDLTVAIEVGVVLAAILFMHRMAEVVAIARGTPLLDDEDADDFARPATLATGREALPAGVERFELRGPLFFGAAMRLGDTLGDIGVHPRVLIIDMAQVPLVDSSGVGAIEEVVHKMTAGGTKVVLTGVQDQPVRVLSRMGLGPDSGRLQFAPDLDGALALIG